MTKGSARAVTSSNPMMQPAMSAKRFIVRVYYLRKRNHEHDAAGWRAGVRLRTRRGGLRDRAYLRREAALIPRRAVGRGVETPAQAAEEFLPFMRVGFDGGNQQHERDHQKGGGDGL